MTYVSEELSCAHAESLVSLLFEYGSFSLYQILLVVGFHQSIYNLFPNWLRPDSAATHSGNQLWIHNFVSWVQAWLHSALACSLLGDSL